MPGPSALLLVFALASVSGSAYAQLDPALTEAPQRVRAEFTPSAALTASSARSGAEADLVWSWDGDPRWMRGREFSSGEVFFGSIVRGHKFAGSTIGPDGDVSIDIVLSEEETTLAQFFRRDEGWSAAGVGTFPGAVYDVSDPDNPRRLNVAISEDGEEAPANMTWDPDDSEDGNYEYLWIMNSDYDGTGTSYADVSLAQDADDLDILYVWEGRLEPGRSYFESDPATLSIDLARITDLTAVPGNAEVTLTWAYDAPPEADRLVIYRGLDSPAAEALDIVDPSTTSYTASVLDPAARYYYRVEALDAGGNAIDVSVEIRADPVSAFGMTLVGTLDPASRYGDVWGYVDSDTGREYALLTARGDTSNPPRLYVIDVTDDTPVEVGSVPGVADSKDVKTYGHYAYLVNEDAPVQIIDLSDPADPVQVGTLDTGGDDGGSHNVLVEGDYLYVVGGDADGLRIYDLTDPVAPDSVGSLFVGDPAKYYHDVEVRNDTLYGAAIYNQGVDIVDVSDKSAPSLISTFIYAAVDMGAHNVCSTDDGAYVFVGDEIGSARHTRVFDVRDPFDVEQVATIVVNEDPSQPVHNCYVEDDLLYIASYVDGVRVYDVADPEAPVATAHYDTYLGSRTGFYGTWTVYPYLPSGKIIASDMQSGLYVLRLGKAPVASEPNATPVSGSTLDAAYPNPTTGALTVPFLLAEDARVRIVLFDVLGREVAVLTDAFRNAGPHSVRFDGSNLPSGAYFYRLEADGAGPPQTRSLTILR
jgi:choice-of-anchor B domain-containing protein